VNSGGRDPPISGVLMDGKLPRGARRPEAKPARIPAGGKMPDSEFSFASGPWDGLSLQGYRVARAPRAIPQGLVRAPLARARAEARRLRYERFAPRPSARRASRRSGPRPARSRPLAGPGLGSVTSARGGWAGAGSRTSGQLIAHERAATAPSCKARLLFGHSMGSVPRAQQFCFDGSRALPTRFVLSGSNGPFDLSGPRAARLPAFTPNQAIRAPRARRTTG